MKSKNSCFCFRYEVNNDEFILYECIPNRLSVFGKTERARDSSVGRAEDCRCEYAVIFRSLVRLRVRGTLSFLKIYPKNEHNYEW